MAVNIIGCRQDGTLIGEDEQGALWFGTEREATWAEVTRTVTVGEDETVVEFWVGQHLVGKSTLAPDTEVGEFIEGQEQVVGGQPVTFRVTDWMQP